MSHRVLHDAGHHHAPDFDGLAIGEYDVCKVGIGRDQAEKVRAGLQVLASEITIDYGNHDVTALGLDGFVDHYY